MVNYVLIFILGFITSLNVSLFVYNYFRCKHFKDMSKTPQKSNSEVDLEEDKKDNGSIYEMSKTLDILDEYLNGGEDERGR